MKVLLLALFLAAGVVGAGGSLPGFAVPAAAPSTSKVLAWGAGGSGQLGNGCNLSATCGSSPAPAGVVGLPAGDPVVAVAGGGSHSLAVTAGGQVWAWGNGGSGQLGNGCERSVTCANSSKPIHVPGLPPADPVVAVSAGTTQSLALTASGGVWGWGSNHFGELGDASTTDSSSPVKVVGLPADDRVVAIAAGAFHGLALTAGGQVWAWGYNLLGQLGNGTTTNSSTPVRVVGLPSGDPVVSVAAGLGHSLALTRSGQVWAWGDNFRGQLGDGTATPDSFTPVRVLGLPGGDPVTSIAGGGFSSLALTAGGQIWSWGDNAFGQLGDGSTTDRSTPVRVLGLPPNDPVVAVTGGEDQSLALTASRQVWTWGDNSRGQLGVGNTADTSTPVQVPIPTNDPVSSIAAGLQHSLVLSEDATPTPPNDTPTPTGTPASPATATPTATPTPRPPPAPRHTRTPRPVPTATPWVPGLPSTGARSRPSQP